MIACLMPKTTMAPITATNMLHRLKPFTPVAPAKLKRKPPASAPTIPRTMSRMIPSPVLFTILLAMKPEIRPSTIHASIDIFCCLLVGLVTSFKQDTRQVHVQREQDFTPLFKPKLHDPTVASSWQRLTHVKLGATPFAQTAS